MSLPEIAGLELHDVIGQGSCGIVYRAVTVDTRTPCAVKVFSSMAINRKLMAIGMRRSLGGRAVLVSVDAGGHGVYGLQGNGSCADNAANAFLTGGVLPARDIHCPAP